jgi:hypothetical protein
MKLSMNVISAFITSMILGIIVDANRIEGIMFFFLILIVYNQYDIWRKK